MKSTIDKLIPALLLALLFAMITLFKDVDRNTLSIERLKATNIDQFKFIVEIRDISLDIQARYLHKDKYYEDKLKGKENK